MNKEMFQQEVVSGQRFEFGDNWSQFLRLLTNERIIEAEKSLKQMLEVDHLQGKNFLDVGSGSGLFSLAARRLGATVFSFDYDPQSVACTKELKHRYFLDDMNWTIEEGSVLSNDYLKRLGTFDIVYSWGVLHHTGAMWQALENVSHLVAPKGRLFIAIYNDQGGASRRWKKVKKLYNYMHPKYRFLVLFPSLIRLWLPPTINDFLRGKPFSSWKTYIRSRGMSPWHDVVDWVGGYPFEVAKPEEIFEFYRKRGFTLIKLKTAGGGHGNNQFVFERNDTSPTCVE